jgi:hypothetical protein
MLTQQEFLRTPKKESSADQELGFRKKNDQMDQLSIHTSKDVFQVNLAQCEAPVR